MVNARGDCAITLIATAVQYRAMVENNLFPYMSVPVLLPLFTCVVFLDAFIVERSKYVSRHSGSRSCPLMKGGGVERCTGMYKCRERRYSVSGQGGGVVLLNFLPIG